MTGEHSSYDSPVRRRQLAETRERILAAGAAVAREFTAWDWRGLTFRAVADRADVSERTVYRYFATERELRNAIMGRLEEEAGVSYEDLDLDGLAEVAALVFAARASFAAPPMFTDDPTFVAEGNLRRASLSKAVAAVTTDWNDTERNRATGLLDVLWSVESFERLVAQWGLDADDATATLTWALNYVAEAIRAGIAPIPTLVTPTKG